ncbi:putative membrane protein [Pseudomonas sp. WPR_5_2]|uniref:DUF2238 domain-containing protein n=1 Tax=Pseudomonas sp. WPR_5_2 TaxID=1907371 RepID=UPI000EB5CA41|nr:DUF2238 domain-containing protein [Pseudomonas sp. WPR_5_2]RKS24864.1 putative membrane protein [Pseudomonas sp. WPR_5_2]
MADSEPAIANPASPTQAGVALATAVALVMVSGIAPLDSVDWLLENVVPITVILALCAGLRHRRLSWQAYLAVLLLLGIHELGAHFTYAKVPYEQWAHALTDHSLNAAFDWKRNQYDRLVHLSYGLLIVIPLREMLCRQTPLRGGWLALMVLSLVLATSALYELVEWIGGEYLGDDQAEAFVATQKDIWDSQKDMALAFLGALICLVLRAALKFRH